MRATVYIVKQHKETTTFSQGGREGFEKEGVGGDDKQDHEVGKG